MMRSNRTGQTTAEYAIVLGVVLAAIVAMQIYVRRGINARLKDASDSAIAAVWGEKGFKRTTDPTAADRQFEPGYASSDYTVGQTTDAKNVVGTGGVVSRQDVVETTTRSGHQTTSAAQ